MSEKITVHPKRVLLGMSGGTHSSVAAVLLQKQGYEVFGAYLKFPENPDAHCSGNSKTEEKVKAFAKTLGISLSVIDVRELFEERVMDPARKSMLINRQKNPCPTCHSQIKIGPLYERSQKLGCQWIATGHRAQINFDADRKAYQVVRGVDPGTDQSFYLYGLDQKILGHVLFPIGSFSKVQIEKLAASFDVSEVQEVKTTVKGASDKTPPVKESCLGKTLRDPEYFKKVIAADFLPKAIIQTANGAEREEEPKYKFAQQAGDVFVRKIGDDIVERKWVYAFKLRPHLVIYGEQERLLSDGVLLEDFSWNEPVEGIHEVKAECRLQEDPAFITCFITFFIGNRVRLRFESPQYGFYPGRTVVFYIGNRCMGGGRVVQELADLPALIS